eukprot:10836512-Ditylum_brightwellii.AAC.2
MAPGQNESPTPSDSITTMQFSRNSPRRITSPRPRKNYKLPFIIHQKMPHPHTLKQSSACA